MGIFYRRPLCLFCACFLTGALAAWLLPSRWVVRCLAFLLLVLAVLTVLCVCFRRRLLPFLTVILCVIGLFGSMVHSYATVDCVQKRARSWAGMHEMELLITESEAEYSHASVYTAQLIRVDGTDAKISVKLTDFGQNHLEAGDCVFVTTVVSEISDEFGNPVERNAGGTLLSVSLNDTQEAYVRRFSAERFQKRWLSATDIKIVSERVRMRLQSVFSSRLGTEVGSLASALLLGDRSALSSATVRDFRRAGLSHMMAVSGLHISVLLGGLERLLRCLYVPKRARIVTVAAGGCLFLFLAGFSLSAVRSVLMLFSVYLHFLLRDENDSLTALFVSIVLILLIAPYAVADIGMWMSFLATLGLLTVYPLLETWIRVPKPDARGAFGLRILRKGGLILGMTAVANLFLLPIVWLLFGELSWIAPIANLLLSFPVQLFLWFLPFALGLGWIPHVGVGLCRVVTWCGQVILTGVERLSRVPYATLSLNDTVGKWMIPLICLALAVTLTFRFHHKRCALIPLAAVLLSVTCCLGLAWQSRRQPILRYCRIDSANEYFFSSEGQALSICDVSGGSVSAYEAMEEQYAALAATEIRSFVLTHYHSSHAETLTSLLQREVIRTLYLPIPEHASALAVAGTLVQCAENQGTQTVFYYSGDVLSLSDSVNVRVEWSEQNGRHAAIGLDFSVGGNGLSYLSANAVPTSEFAVQSDTALFGCHGGGSERTSYGEWIPSEQTTTLIYAARSLLRYESLPLSQTEILVPEKYTERYTLVFPLS